jgi:integrase
MYEKRVQVDWAPKRAAAEVPMLGAFIESYIAVRTDAEPGMKLSLRICGDTLIDYFGANKSLADVTDGDAEEFRLAIRRRLSENAVSRICGRAHQFFNAAVKRRLIASNPFSEIKGINVMTNKSREHFISRDVADKVLAACPDAQWRLLFALSRFGGLRCPSEHLALRWSDINWEQGTMTVQSPKTEHHSGKEDRVVPIFAELRPFLDAVFEKTADSSKFVITRYRDTKANLLIQLERIILNAGLTPWQKPFENLRNSRETELADNFPMHVVCAWIGNSQAAP